MTAGQKVPESTDNPLIGESREETVMRVRNVLQVLRARYIGEDDRIASDQTIEALDGESIGLALILACCVTALEHET